MRKFLLRDHFEVYRHVYLALGIIIILFAAVVIVDQHRIHRLEDISTWPPTKAIILESDFQQLITESETGSGVQITGNLLLGYSVNNKSFTTRYTHTWPLTAMSDYEHSLSKGNSLTIRYLSADPTVVSLYPQFAE
jgi:hypothetical protein